MPVFIITNKQFWFNPFLWNVEACSLYTLHALLELIQFQNKNNFWNHVDAFWDNPIYPLKNKHLYAVISTLWINFTKEYCLPFQINIFGQKKPQFSFIGLKSAILYAGKQKCLGSIPPSASCVIIRTSWDLDFNHIWNFGNRLWL